jgi:hypothetical protein
MLQKIRTTWDEKPLILILGSAILFRLIAVILARGWGMIDDHFLVIESSQSWVDGHDYNSWLPGSDGNHGPTGHNLFYPGLHFLLFSFLKLVNIDNPQVKMIIVRFIHAAFSLFTVYYGYRITEKLDSRSTARTVGLLLAIYWFMPWMSVRNLVEMVCIPFLVMGIWVIVRNDKPSRPFITYLIAGLFFGLSVVIRPQTAVFSLGVSIVLLSRKQWKELPGLITGIIIPFVLISGGIDFFIWGRPFVEFLEYIRYNLSGKDSYIVMPWYNYLLVVWGLLLPPVSLFLSFGYLRTWKKHLILFLPSLLFFILHSCISNKQERFILPFLPFFIILGCIGWYDFLGKSTFWQKRKKLLYICWIFFWVINVALLPFVSSMYSKKARAETMSYLRRYPDIRQLLVADYSDNPELFPCFYSGQWPHIYEELRDNENTAHLITRISKLSPEEQPRFILFTGDKDLQVRVISARKSFPFLVYETTIETGLIDKVMHWLNPINANRRVYIYRNTAFIPDKR